jgi:16S rRNA (uracil1498-N3)-methyltransferase
MRIYRAFSPQVGATSLMLEGDEAQHLGRVLRAKPGDTVDLFDGQGAACRYRVDRVERRAVHLTRAGEAPPDVALPCALRVAVAPPKGKRAQRLVEGLTELGVTELRFLSSARTQAKLPEPEQVRRWALEACKQCGRNRVPTTGPALSLPELRAAAGEARLLVGDPRQAQPLGLAAIRPEATWVVVGPEGGLSAEELASLRDQGGTPVRLGPAVLRVETAALGLVAALVAQWEASGEAHAE